MKKLCLNIKDKPDLRNLLIVNDITEIFTREDVSFEIFKKLVKSGSIADVLLQKILKINQELL